MHIREKIILSFVLGGTLLGVSQFGQPSRSANLTQVTATLSNARPSVLARISSSDTSSVVIKSSSTDAPSLSVDQLQEGDEVALGGNAGGLSGWSSNYIVQETDITNNRFATTANIAAGMGDADDFVIATQSSNLVVNFTTAQAVNGDGTTGQGHFRVLVPARSNSSGAGNDGIPDSRFFDFKSLNTTTDTQQTAGVTCPTASGYTFQNPVALAGQVQIGSDWYHSFTCTYTGAGSPGTAVSNFTITNLNNPAPNAISAGSAANHVSGTADTYKIIVQQMDGTNVVDQTSVSIGLIEAVKVTAEVPPQITFTIGAVSSGASACGITTGVTTTATAVPFGELVIGTPKLAAQVLGVSTNAVNGYVVTAAQNDQMGLAGQTCASDPTANANCIIDSLGDSPSLMSQTSVEDWNGVAANNTTYGLAYTLATASGTPSTRFDYATATGNCAGTGDCYRQFADTEASQQPVDIFSYSTVTSTQQVNVCYKINVAATQPAGIYSNYLTYRATATF